MPPPHSRPLSRRYGLIHHETELCDDKASDSGFEPVRSLFYPSLAFGLAGRHTPFSVDSLPPLKGHRSRYLIEKQQTKKLLQKSAFATSL